MIGGGESIQGMITSLGNNKKLLRSKRLFKKERTFLNIKKEYLDATEGKVNLKKASKQELKQIRKKIIKERRKENIILTATAMVMVSIIIYFTIHTIQQNNINTKNQQTIAFKKKEKEFLRLINEGDEWFEKGKWYNSIFYYEKAKEIFQKNYEINYRLVRSYSFQCESEFKNCSEAKKLVDNLFHMFPDKEKELSEIKDKLEYEY